MKTVALLTGTLILCAVMVGCGGKLSERDDPPPVPRTVVTESGLQYQDIKVGTGVLPSEGDLVTFDYAAYLPDQQLVESTMDPGGNPLEVTLGRREVIAGLEEGLYGMKIGGQRRLVVRPELAYGAEGKAPKIPGDTTLVYYVQVLGVRSLETMPSGLKYIDLIAGSGPEIQSGETAVVNYVGWLTDGTKFDSSMDEGRDPFEFKIGARSVIAGWDEGVPGMRVGTRRRLVVPADLGYGEEGSPPSIPPNATLIFEIELLEIKP